MTTDGSYRAPVTVARFTRPWGRPHQLGQPLAPIDLGDRLRASPSSHHHVPSHRRRHARAEPGQTPRRFRTSTSPSPVFTPAIDLAAGPVATAAPYVTLGSRSALPARSRQQQKHTSDRPAASPTCSTPSPPRRLDLVVVRLAGAHHATRSPRRPRGTSPTSFLLGAPLGPPSLTVTDHQPRAGTRPYGCLGKPLPGSRPGTQKRPTRSRTPTCTGAAPC